MKISLLTHEALPTRMAATTKKVGGLNTIIYNLSETIADSLGHDVDVICCSQDDNQERLEIPASVGFTNVILDRSVSMPPNSEETFVRYAETLRRQYKESPESLIHTSGSEAGYIMALARNRGLLTAWVHTNYATLAVRRVVIDGMSTIEALSDPVAKRESVALSGCDHVIALSETDKDETCDVFGITRDKVTAVLPGIDHGTFTPGEQCDRKNLVVSAGRMSKVKDFPFLITAFRMAIDLLSVHTPTPTLVIIGGNERERDELGLPQLVKSLSLQQHIQFFNGMNQDELAKLFQQARVFVGCSRHETFGLLPVEARACGAPWIARSNSGYLSTAVNGCGGYFTDNCHEQDMASKIAKILALTDEKWEELSTAAVKSTSQYNWLKTAQDCVAVYESTRKKML